VAVGVVDGLALLQQFDRAIDALGSVHGETKSREREDEKQSHWFFFRRMNGKLFTTDRPQVSSVL